MAPTAAQIARLRQMIGEPTQAVYPDEDLTARIAEKPLTDLNGQLPTYPGPTGLPLVNPYWIETYDLNAVAADIWDEKAGAVGGDFDVSADGATLNRSQVYEHCAARARLYRSRRSPKVIRQSPQPQSRGYPSNWGNDLEE